MSGNTKKIFYKLHAKQRMKETGITEAMVEETVRDESYFVEKDGVRIKHENYPTAVVFIDKGSNFLVVTAFKIKTGKKV